jgi:DNA-damage-inducible protein D
MQQEKDEQINQFGLRYYVYALAYPDGRIFYIGKGKENRILDHEADARKGMRSHKCDIIREIWAHGEEVIKVKLAIFNDSNDALLFESSLISSLGGLSNIYAGRKEIKDAFLIQQDLRYFGISIRQLREDGTEFWSAREVADFLGYITWAGFEKVLQRAIKHWQNLGNDIPTHFLPSYKIVQTSSGRRTKRTIHDYHLSRKAFLEIIIFADPSLYVVSMGKSYVASMAVKQFGPIQGLRNRDIQQLQSEEQKRIERQQQPSLFDEPTEAEEAKDEQ